MLRLRILDAAKCEAYGNSDVQGGETRPCDHLPVSRYVPLCGYTRSGPCLSTGRRLRDAVSLDTAPVPVCTGGTVATP